MRKLVRPITLLAVSPTQAANGLQLDRSKITAAITAGEIIVRVIGSKRRISVRDLYHWFNRQPRG